MGSMGRSSRSIEAFIGYDRNLPVQKVAGTIARYRNGFDRILTTVEDVRGEEECYSLDVHGFAFVSPDQLGAATPDYYDATYIKSTVYHEAENLLRVATGAKRVHCFSHMIRHQPLSAIQSIADDKDIPDTQLTKLAVPSPAVHIDHSAKGSWEILVDNLGEEEATTIQASGKRWGIINLWRPLKTVHRDPLCICDARTVEAQDLVPQRIYLPKDATSTFKDVSRGASFESVGVRPNPKHRWLYCSDMTPDEALLIKIHDSAAGGAKQNGSSPWIAGGVPHTSLQIPGSESMAPRESIELRFFVFWE